MFLPSLRFFLFFGGGRGVLAFLSNACIHAELLQSCPTLQPYGQQPNRLLCPRDSPGKDTGVGGYFLLRFFLNVDPFPGKHSWVLLGIFLSHTPAPASVATAATVPPISLLSCFILQMFYH